MSERSIAYANRPAAPAFSPVKHGVLQRKCACGQQASGGECEGCKKKKGTLQRKATAAAGPAMAPPIVHEVLSSPGQPLDKATRDYFEPKFGYDFSKVRVHTDVKAAESAESVSANAFTVANQIVFNKTQYKPTSVAGRRLLAHELSHVVQQRRGGLPAGIDADPALEHAAESAAQAIAAGSARVSVMGSSGPALARDAKPGADVTYEVKFPEGTRRLTAAELEVQKQEASRRIRSNLTLVADLADVGRDSQNDMLRDYQGGVESLWDVVKKPKALIGIAADMKAGVTPPYIGNWSHPKRIAQEGLADLDKGDLANGVRRLKLSEYYYRDALREWNAYREATIGGAELVARNLETVRDVSFAIALVAAAVVAAPVVAGVVAEAGITGAAATALTTAGTAGTTAVVGGTLRGGSTALATKVNTGKTDWKAAGRDFTRGAKEGAVTGATVGLGSALAAGSTGVQLARPLVQQAVRGCLTKAGINIAGEVTGDVLNRVLPDEPGSLESAEANSPSRKAVLPAPASAALSGCISGAVGVPIGKVGSTVLKKGAETAVTAGVGYADARLAGQSHSEALAAAVQGTATGALIQHGQASHEKAPARQHTAAAQKTGEGPGPKTTRSAEQIKAEHPLAKKFAMQTKTSEPDVSPAILKEDAVAKKPTVNGHEAVVTKQGVARCSPSPCPVIHVEYARELNLHPELRDRNNRIQALRKSDPSRAAEEASELISELEHLRIRQRTTYTSTRRTTRRFIASDPVVEHVRPGALGPTIKPSREEALAIAAASQHEESSSAHASTLPRALSDKTVARSAGGLTISGYTPLPESPIQATPARVAKHTSENLKLTLRAAGALDTAGTEPGFKGKYHAAHAEVQQMVARPNHPVGVSSAMCDSCRSIFKAEAKFRKRSQVVSDPQATRVFDPDGTITEYWKNGPIVRFYPDGSVKVH
ncbi:MAG TPA: DUF4157 domain-containing protein [Candidatus Angelobacter sp.]|jgi:hypothetical protein